MTKSQAIKEHRKMWNCIGKKSLEEKRIVKKDEYLSQNNITLLNNNFCCQYMHDSSLCLCDNCPIQWKLDKDYCAVSIYMDCACDEWYIEYAKTAFLIANLPENNP